VLVESLIRLGRPFVEGGAEPLDLLRQVSDVTDVRARNFFQRVFVVEIAQEENERRIIAHPYAAWGHMESDGRTERFQQDEDRVIGIPFVMPRGNPRAPQGRYPVPVYIVYDKDFVAFRNAPKEVKRFLEGRVSRTIGVSWTEEVLDEISKVLAEEFERYVPAQGENCLGVIVIADLLDPDSPYIYESENNSIALCESRLRPGRKICVDVDRLLKRVWIAKAAEGAEMGSREGTCSVCGTEGELVSIYSKAWSWFSVTWTAPLPSALKQDQLVEGVALCASCYAALTMGAQVFSSLEQTLPSWLTKEIFSPVASARAKEEKRRSTPEAIYGSLIALPVLDEFINNETDRKAFVRSVASMRFDRSGAVQRHLDTITGFEARLPLELSDDRLYRLQLYYYSGDVGRGDVHLRGVVEDIVPSVASAIDDLLRESVLKSTTEAAAQLELTLTPFELQQFRSLPFLLVTAYGAPYLWQSLADILHKRTLGTRRFIANASSRMQSLARHLPSAFRKLRLEVLFYLVFRDFIRAYHEQIVISRVKGREPMRSWKELQAMLAGNAHEVHFEDVEELGFASGHLTRQFSRWYYKQTGKDFLRHRVMVFGSDLTPELVWQRALSKFGEYRAKLWREGSLPQWFERLLGLVLMEYSHRREEIRRERDAFMAAFWAGYSLQAASEKEEMEDDHESELAAGGSY